MFDLKLSRLAKAVTTACSFLLLVGISQSQDASPDFSLTVEATPAVALGDAMTYRFYVNMMGAGDRMSSVYGLSLIHI